jgi:hypothetical protein
VVLWLSALLFCFLVFENGAERAWDATIVSAARFDDGKIDEGSL